MVATAAAFTLATLRAGAVQIPAIGTAGAYWPLAAAAPAGFAGLDSDIKGVLVNWPVAFPSLSAASRDGDRAAPSGVCKRPRMHDCPKCGAECYRETARVA